MIRIFKNILISLLVICFTASVASALSITSLYRMKVTPYASLSPGWDISKTYDGVPTTEVRQYLAMAVTSESMTGFTSLDAGSRTGRTQNSLIDNVRYGISINGYNLSVTSDIYYWNGNAICFSVPEGVLAGNSVQIQVIDDYATATYTVDVLPPATATFESMTISSGLVELKWLTSVAQAGGGYSGITTYNCGVLVTRTTSETLDTSYLEDGVVFSSPPSGTAILFDENRASTTSEALPPDGYIYYYQTFIHDGKPNYNRTPDTRELNLRYNIAGVFEPSGSDAGAPLSNAEPGTDIHITGEGFDNSDGTATRKIEFFEDGTTTSLFSFDSGDIIASGRDASHISWWVEAEYCATEEGHIVLTIPSTVTYRGEVDIVVTNGAGLVTTYEGFSIVTDSGVIGPPTITGTYTTGTSGFVVTTEARVSNYIYVLGSNFGSDTTITMEGASRSVTLSYDLNASTEVGFRVPTIEAGSVNIVISNSYGITSCAFTVLAPERVYSLSLVSEGDGQVTLSMLDNTWAATNEVVYSTTRAATNPADSVVIGRVYGGVYTGGTHFVTKTGLTNGTTYYFSAFAGDGLNYSAARTVIGTPESGAPTISGIYNSTGSATVEGKVGSYIQIVGTNLGASSTEVRSIRIGGVSLPSSSYRWDYSTSISVWLPQGVKTGDITVEVRPAATSLFAKWGHTFTIKPPDQVYNLQGEAGDRTITLTWGNPDWDGAFYRTLVVRGTSSITWVPTNEYTAYTAGTTPVAGIRVVYHGTLETAADTGLTNGTRYYYRAFARDLAGHYNTTEVTASATPDSGAPRISSITNYLGTSTTEGKVGDYIEINGVNFGTVSTALTGVKIGGVTISADDGSETSGYEWYSSTKVGIWLPQGVKTGYVTVETTVGRGMSTGTLTINPPDQVVAFNATAGMAQASLTWSNPTWDSAFSATMIARSTVEATLYGWTPTNERRYNTGEVVASVIRVIFNGTGSSTTDAGLVNGTKYYYRAYAHDLAGHYATTKSGATDEATPDAGLPSISSITNYLGTATTEGRVGDYIEINGTNFGTASTALTGVKIGGVTISADDGSETSGYEWYSSTKVGIWLPQGVKTGYVTVETTVGRGMSTGTLTIKPPSQVYYLGASAGNSQVLLIWANPSETAFSGTLIARSTSRITWVPTNEVTSYSAGSSISSGGKTIRFIYNSSGSTTIDATVTNGTQYYYRAYAHDQAGHYNTTEVYDSATPEASASSTVPVIDDAFRYIDSITTTTEVYVGQHMAIQGRNLGAGTYEVYVGGQAAEYDTTEENGAYYLSVFVPVLRRGSTTVEVVNSYTGERSNIDRVTVIPPEPPYYLNVTSGDSMVGVDWRDNYQDGVAATVISRSTTATPESTGLSVTGTIIYTTYEVTSEETQRIIDYTVDNGTVYYYNVFAFDGINYSDGYTLSGSQTNVGTPQEGVITISGLSTTETKVGQRVGFSVSGMEEDELASAKIWFNGTVEATPTGNEYYVEVTVPAIAQGTVTISLEAGGKISNSLSVNILPPNPPYYFSVRSGDSLVTVNWTDNHADGGVAATVIVRSTSATPETYNPTEEITRDADIDDSSDSYSDTGLTNGVTYYYNAFSFDGVNYSAGVTLQSGWTNVGHPTAGSGGAGSSDPQITSAYSWNSYGAITSSVQVGHPLGINGSNLGAGTYEVYVNGVQTTYTTTESSAGYIEVYVPVVSAGAVTLTVSNPATGVSSDPYTGLTVVGPNPPYYFNVISGNSLVMVNWMDNHSDGGVAATFVVKATSTEGTPESISDGTTVYATYEISGAPHMYEDRDVTNGEIYYYNVFSYDGANFSSGYTLNEGQTNVGHPQAASASFSPPQIYGAYGWRTEGITTEVKVGQGFDISGANLGAGTYEVYVNGTLATYSSEAQSQYYLKVFVPTVEAGAVGVKVTVPGTTYESNTYAGLTVIPPSPPYALNVTSGDGLVYVSWTDNYSDSGIVSTLLVRSTDGTPETYADGTQITSTAISYLPHTYPDTGLTNGVTYYYNVFSYDGANYSTGVTLQSGWTNVGMPTGVATAPAVSNIYYVASLGGTIGSATTEAAIGTCISIAGARLSATGEVVFTDSDGEGIKLYSTDHDNVAWWGDGTRVDVKVPSSARSGYLTVIRDEDREEAGTPYLTITGTGEATDEAAVPSISGISPDSGGIGDSLTISGIYFGDTQGSSEVVFEDAASAKTYAAVTSWADVQVVAKVPAGLDYSEYEVYLLISGEATNSKTFTVTAGGSMVIDDYNNSATSDYYTFDSTSSSPLVEVQNTTVYEGANAMKVLYTFKDLSGDWGGGFGKELSANVDLSTANYVVMYVKGDGSNNTFRLDLVEADYIDSTSVTGETWSSAAVALYNTGWHKVVLNLSAFTRNSSGAVGNGTFDGVIEAYHIVYTSEAVSSTYHYIDYIAATTEAVEVGDTTPVIASVNPREAVVGSTVLITGTNFGSEEGESQVTLDDTAIDAVTYWSDTMIIFTLPTTFTTKRYDLCVYRKNSTLSIDELSEPYAFDVIAASTKAKAYPNPFNPLGDGTIKIEVTVTEATTVSLYLYDMAARMVDEATVTLLAGTNQIEWNGRDYTGNVVGDGVYLIRVVNSSTKELIAKGKILVIKRI